jgi:hypothetical protein
VEGGILPPGINRRIARCAGKVLTLLSHLHVKSAGWDARLYGRPEGPATTKKGRPIERPFQLLQNARSSRFWRDDWRGGFFGLGRCVFAFEVALPAFSVFNFVVLSAHNSLLSSLVAVLWCAI